MSIQKGILTYIGDAEVLCWYTLSEEESTVTIGNYCSLAKRIKFYVDGNHRYDHASTFPFFELGHNQDTRNKNCWGKGAPKIGHDVWIGNDAVLMSGITIGHGSIIGANSVVTRDVPPYAIVAGNPARIVKYRFDVETIQQFLDVQWWDLPQSVVIEELAPLQYDVELFLDKAQELRWNIDNGDEKKEEDNEENDLDEKQHEKNGFLGLNRIWKRIRRYLTF
jgi:acetyltransferase-like isoleucine patch superfamily enzyme